MTVHLYELDSSKDVQEYQNVQARFQKTCSNPIVKIERVQNPVLYRTYAIRKQIMDEGKGSNEHWLFHGTPGVNRQLVNHTGFNRSFHGKNGKRRLDDKLLVVALFCDESENQRVPVARIFKGNSKIRIIWISRLALSGDH